MFLVFVANLMDILFLFFLKKKSDQYVYFHLAKVCFWLADYCFCSCGLLVAEKKSDPPRQDASEQGTDK